MKPFLAVLALAISGCAADPPPFKNAVETGEITMSDAGKHVVASNGPDSCTRGCRWDSQWNGCLCDYGSLVDMNIVTEPSIVIDGPRHKIEIKGDGAIYVNGKLMGTDKEVYEALLEITAVMRR